ncbi:MAG: Fic family protein, partial [Gemmatimonadaceae bacterium]
RMTERPNGREVPTIAGGVRVRAFVPYPLPPQLHFDTTLVSLVDRASRGLGELAGTGRRLANPALLIRPFVRREAVLSSRIEGTQAGAADLYAWEAGQLELPGLTSAASSDDVREVLNYERALGYGLRRLDELPVSLRYLRELHERLLHGVRGEHAAPGRFRTTQNWIGGEGLGVEQARYVPPPVPEMRECLDALEKYIHADSDLPPLVRLALIHYQFEAIHPFADGNGRIGRLLIALLMVHWGLLPHPLLYLSAWFEAHRGAYYDHLLAVSQRGAWEPWVRYFLEGVVAQSADATARVVRIESLEADWRERLTRADVSGTTLRLMVILFEAPAISIPWAADRLGVTYRSAQRAVQALMRHRMIQPADRTARYGKVYVATQVLDVASGR